MPRRRQLAQVPDSRGRHAATGNVLRDPVAEFRGAILDVDQVEPAEYRAVLGDEHIEGAGVGLLLSRQGFVPVGELVEVAAFEAWQPAGRTFDAVIAAQSWHWVDPVAGAVKAAHVLRPGGRLAIFGHVYEPPTEVAEPFAAAYRRAAPDSPLNGQPARRPLDLYQAAYAKFADKIRETEQFNDPEQWLFDWEQSYTRDQWLDLLPTTGGLTQLRPDQLAEVLDAVGGAIDSLGGRFTMDYTTLAATAVRAGTS
ncbi:class I SAM-dependent methyltransferase [Streptomyces mirabilis]|uniref:class I SAM-dependent methyltransferase n=1 Tax=Streptomyces mirabilis TaxID=68239 RepID=UPI0036D7EFF5